VLPDTSVLFEDDETVVTPSWLQLGRTSHAIRTIVRLDYHESATSRTSLIFAFFFSLLLILASGIHVFRESVPPLLAWAMLSASLILMLIIAWFAFVVPPRYRLDITLVDGAQLQVTKNSRAELTRIHQALSRAMDWHRGIDNSHDRF